MSEEPDSFRWEPTWDQGPAAEKRRKILRWMMAVGDVCPWMHGPVLNLVTSFWLGLLDVGIVGTCKPRWGGLTFSYLNDGIRPTAYHMVWSVLDPRTPIYPKGAPRNRSEL